MKVRVQEDGLGPSQELENLRSVVVYDDHNQPILLLQKLEEGRIVSYKCTDPEFRAVLKILGIGLNATCKLVEVGKKKP